MKAVILAAGEGTRLRPLTYHTPKPLLDVAGKPILQYTLEQLKGLVDEVIVIIGYKGEMIEEFFGEAHDGLKIRYVWQKRLLGTADAIRLARDYIQGKFLLLMGDTVYSKVDMVNALKNDLCILVKEVEKPRKYGVVVSDEEGNLKGIVEKPQDPPSNLANTALYVLDEEIFPIIDTLELKENGEYDFTEALMELSKRHKIHCLRVQGVWLPVGYPDELDQARELLKREPERVF